MASLGGQGNWSSDEGMSMTEGVMDCLPDGRRVFLYTFHVCMKGLESKILYRVDEDYDVFVKMIFVCAHRLGVQVIIYGVVSNHAHICLLASDHQTAKLFGERLKMMYSRYYRNKYGEEGVLRRVEASALHVDSDRYLRNVLAYIPRNALDNGARNVSEYRWTGYRAMFCGGKVDDAAVMVRDLNKRERERIMHTGDKLDDVPWVLNSRGEIEPASCCNWRFLENVFCGDQAFFLRILGSVNTAEMKEKLVDAPRTKRNDNEFLKSVTDICQRWFQQGPEYLSLEKKIRVIPYVSRVLKTDVPQLARTFELSRERISDILNPK